MARSSRVLKGGHAVRLILVRHGQTSSNVNHNLDTAAPGADLTELGREQARALVDALGQENITAVYASDLVRTQQTAAPLAEHLGLEVIIRDGLREISAGDLEMASDYDSIMTYITTVLSWADQGLDGRIPGSKENGHDVKARYDAVVNEAAQALGPDEVAVLFSHGAVMRAWAGLHCTNITREFTEHSVVSNTGAIVIDGEPGNWSVVTWEGQAMGGPEVQNPHSDGPAAMEVD